MQSNEKMHKMLKAIKAIVDDYFAGTITVTIGNDDLDSANRIYDIRVIMGMLSSQAYEGLGLPIPDRKRKD